MTEHERREDIRAEYEAEFDPEPANGNAELAVREVQELLAPDAQHVVAKLNKTFVLKLREARRELVERDAREAAYREQNKKAYEHSRVLAAERDYWQALKDPKRELSELRVENDRLRGALHALEQPPAAAIPAHGRAGWWRRLLWWLA